MWAFQHFYNFLIFAMNAGLEYPVVDSPDGYSTDDVSDHSSMDLSSYADDDLSDDDSWPSDDECGACKHCGWIMSGPETAADNVCLPCVDAGRANKAAASPVVY
jgi:hypothetical protein